MATDQDKVDMMAELLQRTSDLDKETLAELIDSLKPKPDSDNLYDGMTEDEYNSHLDESFDFGMKSGFKVIDDACDRDLNTWGVASQLLYTASFVFHQHGATLDEMLDGVKDAIKHSEDIDAETEVNEPGVA